MSDRNEEVLNVISKLAGAEAASLKPETELVADLGIDSPKALQLLVELEDELGVEISDEEAAKMETVGDVLAFYEGK
ncbi:MAG: acyl carrier protein [Verrucomicrobiota bacterium]